MGLSTIDNCETFDRVFFFLIGVMRLDTWYLSIDNTRVKNGEKKNGADGTDGRRLDEERNGEFLEF